MADFIIVAVIMLSVVLAVSFMRKRKKAGKGCHGDCNGCDGCRRYKKY